MYVSRPLVAGDTTICPENDCPVIIAQTNDCPKQRFRKKIYLKMLMTNEALKSNPGVYGLRQGQLE
jgi:hypothetical protein